MIIDALLYIAFFFLNLIVGLLPASSGFSSDVTGPISYLGLQFVKFYAIFSPVLPTTSNLMLALGTLFFVEIAIVGFWIFRWLASHIPYIGGHKS